MNANFVVTVAWGILLLGMCVCVCVCVCVCLDVYAFEEQMIIKRREGSNYTHTHTHTHTGKWPTRGELLGGAFILVSIISGVIETCVNKDKDEKEITAAKALREAVEEGRKARRGRKKRKKEEKEREKEIAHTQPEAAMALLAKHTHTYTHTQTNPQEEEKGTVGAAPLHVVLVDEEAWGVKGGIDSEGVGVGVGESSSSSSSDDGDGEEEGEEGGEQTLLLKKPHFSARVHIEQDNLTEGSGIYPFL